MSSAPRKPPRSAPVHCCAAAPRLSARREGHAESPRGQKALPMWARRARRGVCDSCGTARSANGRGSSMGCRSSGSARDDPTSDGQRGRSPGCTVAVVLGCPTTPISDSRSMSTPTSMMFEARQASMTLLSVSGRGGEPVHHSHDLGLRQTAREFLDDPQVASIVWRKAFAIEHELEAGPDV